MSSTEYRQIKLKPMKERSVMNFHPWIFSGAIATSVKDFGEGELVEVFDSSNKYLATGHFHHGTIMVRVISFDRIKIDTDFWKQKITSAFHFRKTLPFMNAAGTNTFRLFNGEGDGLPGLIIDIYGTTAVLQAHSEGMQLAVHEIAKALMEIPEINITSVYNKSAEAISKQQGDPTDNGILYGNGESQVVSEYGHKFFVNWVEGQKTGFFLDQRENRKLLADYAKDKNVLNTFCYSGGFSIYALKSGALHVDSVDSSKKAMEWTDRNVLENFPEGASHTSYCEDVFDFLKRKNQEYDVIVLDPPAFAKHLSAVDKAVIGYRNLNAEAIKNIKPGGIIFTFSCSQAIDKQLFRKTIFTAAVKTGRRIRILHQLSQGPDHPISLYHPEGEYLKGLVLEVE